MSSVKVSGPFRLTANGLTECKEAELKINQIFFLDGYGKRDRRAIYDITVSRYGVKQYKYVNLDSPSKGIEDAHSIRPYSEKFGIGLYYMDDQFADPAEIVDAIAAANKAEENRRIANEQAAQARQLATEAGRKLLTANMPQGTKAVIVAELWEDTSDPMTDYFGYDTKQTVIIGFSSHTKDLFSEMRKAAATFEHTKQFGPGKGDFDVVVVVDGDVSAAWHYYRDGETSPFHRDMQRNFTTREEAEAYAQSISQLETIHCDGTPVQFKTKIRETEIEQRQKYSMGKGYYLGSRSNGGWKVRKIEINPERLSESICHIAGLEGGFCVAQKPAPAPAAEKPAPAAEPAATTPAPGKIQFVDYSEKAFAIIGDTYKIKDQLKSLGGSFNARLSCGAGWIFSKKRLEEVKAALTANKN